MPLSGLQIFLALSFFFASSNGSDLPRYNPNLYYGPSVRDLYETRMPSWYPSPSVRMARQDLRKYGLARRSPYPPQIEDYSLDGDDDTVEVDFLDPDHYSPELIRLLQSFLMLREYEEGQARARKDRLGSRGSMSPWDLVSGCQQNGCNPGDQQKQRPFENFFDEIPVNNPDNTPEPEADSSTAKDELEEGKDDEDFDSNRRTFGLIIPVVEMGIKMIDQDLGLGLSSETTAETSNSYSKSRQSQMEINALREAREKSQLEQVKTQASIQALKAESEMVSKSSQAELDSIKSAIQKMSEETERERREKQELQERLESETKLRERESHELKKRLEMEAETRERERLRWQSELTMEASNREKEKLELKNKLEMEAALLALKTKKSSQDFQFSANMDTKSSSQQSYRDYRAPVYYVPSTTKKEPTVGFV